LDWKTSEKKKKKLGSGQEKEGSGRGRETLDFFMTLLYDDVCRTDNWGKKCFLISNNSDIIN
jgi:hypothetical protein